MESEQPVPSSTLHSAYDVEMSESDMTRWLLRLKYSVILRRRLRSSQNSRRQLLGNHPSRSTSCLHFKVLLGLAASAYFLAKDTYPSNNVDLDCDENDLQCKLSTRDIKAILRHRGISAESFFEKKDLEILSARTGLLNFYNVIICVAKFSKIKYIKFYVYTLYYYNMSFV
ncbi:unnamed protein product [Hymenolepis diminuta]|uniref:Uncharacterized protein n=1 Tax=Hymenolepis diminuta TaxID=6216 RepID=A0A564YNF0_HYMDI|nr:unnamed protein product [Hymenolepis diminuta]